jgi:hypothetical protein
MAITLRTTKGIALTHAELDGNFIDLSTRVETIESNTSSGDGINQVIDSGGAGSLSWNSETQVLTYVGASNGEIRSAFTAGNGIGIASGEIAIDFTEFNTTSITEGTNLYFTDARADARIAAAELSNLSNVHTATPADGQVLAWDNGNSRWAPTTASLGSGTLAGLSDVDTSGINNGETIIWNSATSTFEPGSSFSQSDFDTSFAAKTTTDLSEGTNLYFTNARADARIAASTTDNITEGTNLYFTNARADARIAAVTGANLDLSLVDTDTLPEGTTNLYYTNTRWDAKLAAADTDDLSEGTSNLYYTDARADARIAAATGANLDLSLVDTDTLPEGTTNLYYTDAKADARIAAISIDGLADVDTTSSTPTDGQALIWNSVDSEWQPGSITNGSGTGEANDAVNVGTGAEVYKTKVGTDIQLRTLIMDADVFTTTTNSDDLTFTLAPSADFDLNSQKIINLATPTANTDAATKAYVDSQIAGSGGALSMAGDTGTDSVTLSSDTLTISGTTNQITTAVTDNTVTIGLPSSIEADLVGAVTGDVTGNLTGNVTGDVTGTVSDLSNHNTDSLSEGTSNLYYTDARADARIAAATTDDVTEGPTNLYFTNDRADARANSRIAASSISTLSDVDTTSVAPTDGQSLVWSNSSSVWVPGTVTSGSSYTSTDFDTDFAAKTTTDLTEGTNLYFTDARADARIALQAGANLDLSSKSTTDLSEGTNLYHTVARVESAIDNHLSAGTGVTYNAGAISIGQAVDTTDTVTFAGITAPLTGNVTGDLTGNVTGNVTGDVFAIDGTSKILENGTDGTDAVFTGNVTGDLTGNVTGNVTGDVTGNADTATALATARTIELTGDATGSATFDGTGNIAINTTVTGASNVNLGSGTTGNYVATILGTANEIEVSGSGVETAAVTIGLPDDVTIGNDLVVTGNLTVSGTTTTVNTETISLADNLIDLNSNFITGTPTENSGIRIIRGDLANKTLLWNESDDKWTVGTETFVANIFEGDLTGNVTGNVTGDLTGNVTGNVTGDLTGNVTGNVTGNADTATSATSATTATTATTATNVTVTTNPNTNETVYVTFVDSTTGDQSVEVDTNLTYNPSSNTLSASVFMGTAVEALYADLAEIYASDSEYTVGTVVKLGGDAEITQTTHCCDTQVFGVISENPAYLMNSAAEGLPVALSGRISVKLTGAIKKGQRIVSSDIPGVAQAIDDADINSVLSIIGRALESSDDTGEKLIECVVGKF